MTGTAELLLGVIALGVAVMAIVQVGAVLAALRVARRVEQLSNELETGLKPLIAQLTTLSAETAKTASLATTQVERFDKLFTDVTVRVDDMLNTAQEFVAGPAREGMAVVSGIRAALASLQEMRETSRRRTARSVSFEEEEQSLFIG